jgi:hypothetical protein
MQTSRDIRCHQRPTYYALPCVLPARRGYPRRVSRVFTIHEARDGETRAVCTMSNRGDRLNNILKRGIPLEDARRLFYEMDSV